MHALKLTMTDFRAVMFFQLGQLAADIQQMIFDIPALSPEIVARRSEFSDQLQGFIDQIRTFYILDADSFSARLHDLYDQVFHLRSTTCQ